MQLYFKDRTFPLISRKILVLQINEQIIYHISVMNVHENKEPTPTGVGSLMRTTNRTRPERRHCLVSRIGRLIAEENNNQHLKPEAQKRRRAGGKFAGV